MALTETADRPERLARNQSMYRQVNERIEDVNRAFSFVTELNEFVCECANDGCSRPISLTIEEYEQIRAEPTRFAVLPNESHVFPDIEDVVGRTDRFWTVEKRNKSAIVARALDPRSNSD